MDKPIIEVCGISKRYELGEFTAGSLREEIERAWNRFRRRNGSGGTPNGRITPVSQKEFWALKEVSFSVNAGEVIGIIGRNGAGKSTLLKILSRITEPTSGEVVMRGRVASLLEVGTGFHPELSGRENIYLNGSILGMTKAEITRKFDEIVSFVEITTFLDTPVKRYSSGMYVRLAFAVAAHLDPEILIIDEVLAVGDFEFQKKCLGKMQEVATSGRTVIFVSHNMGAISGLTSKAVFLRNGRLICFENTRSAVSRYLGEGMAGTAWRARTTTSHPLQILAVATRDVNGNLADAFEVADGLKILVEYVVRQPCRSTLVEIVVQTTDGVELAVLADHDMDPQKYILREPGTYEAELTIPGELLNQGTFYLTINSGTVTTTFDREQVLSFTMREATAFRAHPKSGLIAPRLPWSTKVASVEPVAVAS